jgi:acyl carrier protein
MVLSDRKQIETGLVEFLQSRLHREHVTAHTDLLEEGFLDSLLLVDLIFQIEERYGLRFESDHISPDNFRTAATIAGLVIGQLETTGAGRNSRQVAPAAEPER